MQSESSHTLHLPEFSTSYESLKCLGWGQFGYVYHVKLIAGTTLPNVPDEIAVKITISPMATDELDKLKKVISLMKHPNVLKLYRHTVLEPVGFGQLTRTAILMEFCQGGSLEDQMDRGLCYTEAVEYTRQVTSGLAFLHGTNIVHMDLKPANVLLTGKHATGIYQLAKLADVDDPVILAHTVTSPSDALGPHSLRYCSPEIQQRKRDGRTPVGRKTDIWSLGYLVHDLMFGASQCNTVRAEKPAVSTARDGTLVVREGFVLCTDQDSAFTPHKYMCERLLTFLQRCLVEDAESRDLAHQLANASLLVSGPTFRQLLDPSQPLWSCTECRNQVTRTWIEQGEVKCPTSMLSENQTKSRRSPNDPWQELQAAVRPTDPTHVKFLADHPLVLTHKGQMESESYDQALNGSLLLGLQEARITSAPFSRIRVQNWIRLQSLTLSQCTLSLPDDFLLESESLKKLTMDFNVNGSSWRSGMLRRLQLPNLAELNVNFTGNVELGDETLKHLPNLKTLYVSFTKTVNCRALIMDNASVEYLIITANDNPDINLSMFRVPNLLHLHLLTWPKMASEMVGFADSTPQLTRLLVRSCSSSLVKFLLVQYWPRLQDFCISPVVTGGKPCLLHRGTTEQRERLNSWPRLKQNNQGQRRLSVSYCNQPELADSRPGEPRNNPADKLGEDYFWLEKHFTWTSRLTRYVYLRKEGNNKWHAKQAPARSIVEYVSFVRGFRHILECGHCSSNVKPLELAGQELRVLFCGRELRRRFQ